ncbi:INACTIVE LEUCINE-RICH REPEAT RECEPTOR-LIKE PROTEIN KINASE-RELATED [Salix purpurea]|uniref:INACTIVE LEUCINE-RICH REPEAT RECEPTOR-LIKE PROTEIN KINASE-RELATED n=1 Tax=Salix purpurea TaxID=77065 RepID=A0A9Q0ZAP4_SALPP|nr:INACTIVE LEUCINE-RICH REPEAT RECEPTOR-LIKE PROTEIN KINASE-RELATED [Salix purpurea]
MAKPVHYPCYLLLLFLILSFHRSSQLQPFQSQSLLRIQQLLNYPSFLTSFNSTTDFCNIEPTPSLTLVCYEDQITQLHIVGNGGVPPNFSTDSFFATVARLSGLKVLSLVSLGFWGALPESIGQLSSLEILNASSNYFSGSIPASLSSLRSLQTLILDHNKFSGEVPGWVGFLPVLTVLSLKNNSLGGYLPDSLTRMESLRILSLSKNNLSGQVPDLHNLTNLQVLELEDNHFGPNFPGLPYKVATLVLRNNSFHSGIPAELVTYHLLQKLDLSFNGFVGPFLPSLLSGLSMNYLDISHNKFTGMLFENMSCHAELAYVDLSSNLLTGELPPCLNLSSESKTVLYARNCLSNQEQEQHPFKFCHNEALAVKILPRDEKRHNKKVLASSTMGGVVGGIAIVGLVVLFVKRVYNKDGVKKPQRKISVENLSTVNTVKLLSDARHISQTMKLGASLPTYRTFSLEELKEATNNFDASNLLGEDSNSQMYKGKLNDGTPVAIRSSKARKKVGQRDFTHHIELISKLRHNHLISALGHCFDCCQDDSSTSRIFNIFEFASNGTLRDYVSGIPEKKLKWPQRIGAAIGVARGIQFLHTGIVPGVFPNNLKITDVLLDHDLLAKLCSYNLPLLTEGSVGAADSSATKQNSGTRGRHEDKKDIYDLGVILVEIIFGRPVVKNEVMVSKDLLQVSMTVDDVARRNIVDPSIHKDCSDESLKIVMEICIRCLSKEPSDRPSVDDVLWNLQFAAQVRESSRTG